MPAITKNIEPKTPKCGDPTMTNNDAIIKPTPEFSLFFTTYILERKPKTEPIIAIIAKNELPSLPPLSRNKKSELDSIAINEPKHPKITSKSLDVDLIRFIIIYLNCIQ